MTANDEYQRISALCDQKKYDEAHNFFQTLSLANYPEPILVKLLFLYNTTLLHLRKYGEALEIADKIMVLAAKHPNSVIMLDALLARGVSLRLFGNMPDLKKSLERCDKLLPLLTEIPPVELGKRQIKLTSLKGNYYWYLGKEAETLKYRKENLDLCRQFGSKSEIARAYGNLALSVKRIDHAIEYIQKSNNLFLELRNKFGAATNYLNLGYYYELQGDLDQSLQNYETCLAIYQEIGNKKGIALCTGNIGTIFYEMGENEKALTYALKNFSSISKKMILRAQKRVWQLLMNYKNKRRVCASPKFTGWRKR